MVRIRDVAWALAAAAVLAGSRPASAAPIALTGNVANDFTKANGSVQVNLPAMNGPGYTDGPTGETAGQLPSGVFMKSVSLNYNPTTDTMYVGVQGYTSSNGQREIFGNITGNPDPAKDIDSSATNMFQNLKSVALAFAPATTGTPSPTIIAGIPAIKPAGTTPGFVVSSYSANGLGLAYSFGKTVAGGGSLAFNPSAAAPDFEFTINNFSKVSHINPATSGMTIQGFIGDPGANWAGKSGLFQVTTPPVPEGITTPEPATWLAWTLLAGVGAGWRYRRRLLARA